MLSQFYSQCWANFTLNVEPILLSMLSQFYSQCWANLTLTVESIRLIMLSQILSTPLFLSTRNLVSYSLLHQWTKEIGEGHCPWSGFSTSPLAPLRVQIPIPLLHWLRLISLMIFGVDSRCSIALKNAFFLFQFQSNDYGDHAFWNVLWNYLIYLLQ